MSKSLYPLTVGYIKKTKDNLLKAVDFFAFH